MCCTKSSFDSLKAYLTKLGHGAANVTLGIPRLREIVMTASQKPKTPSMSMKVKRGVQLQDVESFCKRASRITLSQVVDEVIVKERLKVGTGARQTEFTVEIKFFPKEEYGSEYDVDPADILATFAVKFPLTLKKELQNEMRKLDADLKGQISNLGKGKKVRTRDGNGVEDDPDEEAPSRRRDADDDSDAEEGNADDEKRSRQRKEQVSYESEEESNQDEDIGDEAIEAAYAEESIQDADQSRRSREARTQISAVSNHFHRNLNHATSFNFNESHCVFKLEASHLIV